MSTEAPPTPSYDYFRGDLVYAACDLYNDEAGEDGASAMPEAEPGALLAAAGTRGMIVNVGHPEAAPEHVIYLVSFETGPESNGRRELGLPFGCLAEELTQDEAAIRSAA
jgi:nitrogen fixation protein NifZ